MSDPRESPSQYNAGTAPPADRGWRRVLPVAAVIVLTPLFVKAGLWQLEKAESKRTWLDAFERTQVAPFDEALAGWPESSRYRAVEIEGRYDGERQILLDGQSEGGRAGYDVLTPFVLTGDVGTILVNRGFVPLGPNREPLAGVAVSGEDRRITGRLAPLPRAGLDLGGPAAAADGPWPRVMLYPDRAEVESALGRTVLEPIVWLDPGAPDGFVRNWRVTDVAPARHVAYALQWFAFAATLVVICVVLLWRRRRSPAFPGAQP